MILGLITIGLFIAAFSLAFTGVIKGHVPYGLQAISGILSFASGIIILTADEGNDDGWKSYFPWIAIIFTIISYATHFMG